ncbi:hypothetical protein [Luteolibacter sp. Populi]|uniref:hypothetical protein n=1 Tax=Luteolibacter sp. Populi TaxID=3230487 RepID=UPI00346594B8
MPWATLELDPAVATERDVKRAYAKRLKTCRPDQDPEGFRKLHEVYTKALFELQWRDGGEQGGEPLPRIDLEELPAPAEDSSPRATAVEPTAAPATFAPPGISPGLRAITETFDRLEAAIGNGLPDVADLVREAETKLYENPAEAIRWGELMCQLIAKHEAHPDLRLKPDAMLFELEHGGAAATLAVIERLDREASPQGISNLANLLLQNKQRIANPGAGIAAARLAGAAAFWAKRHTAPLADFAYAHLARGERDFHMQLIDRHAAMANLLDHVPDRLRSFWRQRLMYTPGRDAWDDEESREAIKWLSGVTARRGPVFEILLGILPEDLAEKVKEASAQWAPTGTGAPVAGPGTARQNPRPANDSRAPAWDQSPALPLRRERQRTAPVYTGGGDGGSKFPIWIIGILIFFVLKAAMLSSTCSNSSTSSSRFPPSKPRSSGEQAGEDFLRRAEESARRSLEYQKIREMGDKAGTPAAGTPGPDDLSSFWLPLPKSDGLNPRPPVKAPSN